MRGPFKEAIKSFKIEAPVYLSHVAALLAPGRKVKSHDVMPDETTRVGNLDGWSEDELNLLIEECRRAMDSQQGRFDQVRATARVVFPVSSALLIVFGSELQTVVAEPTNWVRYAMYGVWGFGTALVLLSLLGAGALLVARSEFGAIMPTLVSQTNPPIRPVVAEAYAQQVPIGETTCGTRLTVIRESVTLLALGGLMHLGLWLVNVF